jgi:hypothetical protein
VTEKGPHVTYDLLEQYSLNCLAHASYLMGDHSSGCAVIVDPQHDIDAYLEDATKYGRLPRPDPLRCR